jgi:chromosome segregation ATPase
MYRTPGRVSNAGGRSSRGSSPQSNYGNFRSTIADGQDRVITHLKKEVLSLKKHAKGLTETSQRLTNMQHKYNIILGERSRDEELHRAKDTEQQLEINRLQDELRLASVSLGHRESEVNDLRGAFQRLEANVSAKEEQLAIVNRDLATEFEKYHTLSEEKSRLENDKDYLQKEQVQTFAKAEDNTRDAEVVKGQVTKLKRTIKEHKAALQELKSVTLDVTSEIYKAEEDMKNLLINQKNKETQVNRLNDKANVIEHENSMIDEEKLNLQQGVNIRDETLKSLGDAKAEHLRRETALAREKLTVEQNLEGVEKDCFTKREEIANSEGDKLALQTELKTLKSFYDRLLSENRKLVQGLKLVSEIDERAIRNLERSEKIEHVVAEANREINTAMKVIRD